MTELLTKEKQFIKLNQELDKMAITTAAGPGVAAAQADNRFHTFQKTKGPSTLLRKQGAGDGMVANVNELRTTATTCDHKTMGVETSPTHSQRQTTPSSNMPPFRSKPIKYDESKRCQSSCVTHSRIGPSNNSTFCIKYHNPKFSASPSLEVLVKEESTSGRNGLHASRSGSLKSLQVVEDAASMVQCSQTNNHTVAVKKNISSEGLIKFLKSKIVILEDDHERILQEMAQQKELLNRALEHTNSLEQQREAAKAKNSTLSAQMAKNQKQLEEANQRLKDCHIQQNSLHKELETAKRESKLLTQANSNLEKRLFKANDDLQSARNTLSLMKTAERDQKEAAKKEADTKENKIKSLKKQRDNLLKAYKQQLFLIDNLKRQNILLEQAKMLDLGEKEFAKVLEWNSNT